MRKNFAGATLILTAIFALMLPVGILKAADSTYDFGDAPDSGLTFYTSKGAEKIGTFPSKLASNGSRTAATSEVWLGQKVDKEADSRQANNDNFDDGISVNLKASKTSAAHVFVHLKNPGKISGTAYINLFFDWNKDGKWEDAADDPIASEWAVRNFPVDLSAQKKAVQMYAPAFMAGQNVENIWYRAILSVDQRFVYSATNKFGQGLFEKGEVEDYGPVMRSGKKYKIVCLPELRVIRHGKTGYFRIRPKYASAPNITNILFANSVVPRNSNVLSSNSIRDILIFAANNKGARVKYKSKKIDPPTRVVWEDFGVRARYGKEASVLATCHAAVVHYGKKRYMPVTQNAHDYTLTGACGSVKTMVMGEQTVIMPIIRPNAALLSQGIYGVAVPFNAQHPNMSLPDFLDLDVDGLGMPAGWQCGVSNGAEVCQGTTPIQNYASLIFYYNQTPSTLNSMHIHLLDSSGNVMGAAELPSE